MSLEVLPNLETSIQEIADSTQAHFDFAEHIANEAIIKANEVTGKLLALTPTYTDPSYTFNQVNTYTAFAKPTAPTAPTIPAPRDFTPVAPPALQDLTMDWPSAPDVDYSDLVSISDIAPPSLDIPEVPLAPEVDFNLEFPTAPDITLPTAPTMLPVGSVSAPGVSLPTFNDLVPQYSGSNPGTGFSFSETKYTSQDLTNISAILRQRLQGGTGLNPIVEAAIWNRGKDREAAAGLVAERNLLIDSVSLGFSRPPGSVLSSLDSIAQQTQSKLIELSREVMIKQAEMEQENLKDAIKSTLELEDMLIKQNLAVSQRALEAAIKAQEFIIDVYKTEVQVYNARVEGYKASASAFAERIRGELARVEVFKAQIAAEESKASTNQSLAKMYESQIQGVRAKADIYQVLVNSTADRIKAEAVRLEAYKAEVSAYSEQVKAQGTLQDSYAKQVQAQVSKLSVNETKARIAASKFDGYSKLVEGKSTQLKAKIAAQEVSVRGFIANVDALAKHAEVQKDIYLAGVNEYTARSANYRSDIDLAKAEAEIGLETIRSQIEQNKYTTEVQMKNAEINATNIKGAFDSLVEATKAAGTITSALASSALSSLNINSSLQGSMSLSGSDNNNTER